VEPGAGSIIKVAAFQRLGGGVLASLRWLVQEQCPRNDKICPRILAPTKGLSERVSFLAAADIPFVRDITLGVALGILLASAVTWAWRRLLRFLS